MGTQLINIVPPKVFQFTRKTSTCYKNQSVFPTMFRQFFNFMFYRCVSPFYAKKGIDSEFQSVFMQKVRRLNTISYTRYNSLFQCLLFQIICGVCSIVVLILYFGIAIKYLDKIQINYNPAMIFIVFRTCCRVFYIIFISILTWFQQEVLKKLFQARFTVSRKMVTSVIKKTCLN